MGTGLAAVTSLLSALAYGYFRDWPNDSFDPTDLRNWVVLGVFLVVTLMANTLAGVVRARAAEADLTAERQAALRRVATAVAQGCRPATCLTVTTELANALRAEHAALFRYEPDGRAVLVAVHDESGASRCRSANTSGSTVTTSRRECCARVGSLPSSSTARNGAWRW